MGYPSGPRYLPGIILNTGAVRLQRESLGREEEETKEEEEEGRGVKCKVFLCRSRTSVVDGWNGAPLIRIRQSIDVGRGTKDKRRAQR